MNMMNRATAQNDLYHRSSGIQMGTTDLDHRMGGLVDALASRMCPSVPLTERAKAVGSNVSIMRLARAALEGQGVSFTTMERMSNADLAQMALSQRTHSTSDFPALLGDSVNKSLRGFYESTPPHFRKFATKENLLDFRPKTIVNVSGLGMPQKVPQGGEYKRTTMAEGTETIKLEHEGTIIGFTLQALVNDDLGALANLTKALSTAAVRAESRDFYQHLISNPTMGDGVPLFHASRGNTAAGGSLATDAALQVAYTWMWTRKDAMGNPIMGGPGFLLVPTALKIPANKLYFGQLMPETVANVVGVRGQDQPEIIADPFLDLYGTASLHYLIRSSDYGAAFTYGYLEGAEGPQVATQTNFNTGGIDFRLSTNFAVGAVDPNGVFQLT